MVIRWVIPLMFAFAIAAAPAAGQGAPNGQHAQHVQGSTASTETVEVDPLRCWWRTSVGAVRVGEPFAVVLTCDVVETDAVTVVPNEAELDPNAIQLPPFEVLGGAHGPDLRITDHRFFQYQYRVRVIGEDVFGKDVKLPELKIIYKVRSRVASDAVEGRDQTYVMPAISIRVLSVVPADATDIRDASLDTFGDIDRRTSRANVLRVVAGGLFGFAALAALVALVRVVKGARRRAPVARALVSDAAILRQIGRELSAIRHARNDGEWTPGLAARLLTALRILSAYALDLPPTSLLAAATPGGAEGQITVRGRGWRGAKVAVPAWVTAGVISEELVRRSPNGRTTILKQLQTVLAQLTAVQYSRETKGDDATMDQALALGVSVRRRMRIENVGLLKKVRALGRGRPGLESVWSR